MSATARRYLTHNCQSGMPIVELRDVTLWAHGRRLAPLARALAKSPRLLVLDEPHRDGILSILDELCKRRTSAVVLVTHDPREIPRSVERVLRQERGRAQTIGEREGDGSVGYEHGRPV